MTEREQKRVDVIRRKAIRTFNKLLKDENIVSIVESNGKYCTTFKDNQKFICSGYVVENSNIFVTG